MKENKSMGSSILRLNFILISCYVFMLASCSPEKIKMRTDIISPKILTCILFDMHMHDGIVNASNNEGTSSIFLSQEHYEHKIFNKYGCSDSTFKLSVEYYTFQGEIKDIYAEVLDSLNTMKSKLEQERQRKIHASRKKRQNSK